MKISISLHLRSSCFHLVATKPPSSHLVSLLCEQLFSEGRRVGVLTAKALVGSMQFPCLLLHPSITWALCQRPCCKRTTCENLCPREADRCALPWPSTACPAQALAGSMQFPQLHLFLSPFLSSFLSLSLSPLAGLCTNPALPLTCEST